MTSHYADDAGAAAATLTQRLPDNPDLQFKQVSR